MCNDCFRHTYYQFESEQDFESLETQLQEKLDNHQLLVVPKDVSTLPQDSLNHRVPEMLYKCQSCMETWAISTPDNAWRGYFLPQLLATSYVTKLERRDRIRGLGCVTFLFALAIWFIWKFLH